MAGYIRQDTTNKISNGSVVDADDLDAEFNAIEAAFNASTGHVHDGSSANGAAITKIGPSQDVVATASTLEPKTDNTVDLGTTTKEFKDLYLQGDAKVGSITLGGTAITATAASINAIGGITATSTELNYTSGVTSPIQTQLGNKQPLNSALTSISGLSTTADRMIYTTSSNSYAVTPLTSVARALLDDATVSDQRATLGVAIGTNVQAWDADLDAIAALTKADGTFIVGNGSTWVAETGNTAIASLGISATGTELSYVSGATSNIQTQLNTVKDSPFTVTGNALAGAEIRLPEITTNGSNYVALKAPANLASNVTLTLPTTDGFSGDLLQTDGSGNLSFISAGSLGGGTVTSVGVSGGTTGLTTSGGPITGSGTITIAGTLAVANGGTGATSAASALTNLGAQATITGGASSITSSNLTASRALVSDASGKVAASSVSATELGYLSSATSSIQNQLNAKQPLDSDLTAIASLAVTDGNFIVGNGATWVAENGATARTSLGLGSLATLSTIDNSNWSGTDLSVSNGGTGASSFTANNVLLGNGTSSFQVVAPGTSGNLLTSNGSTWTSAAPPATNSYTLLGTITTTSGTTQTLSGLTLTNYRLLYIEVRAVSGTSGASTLTLEGNAIGSALSSAGNSWYGMINIDLGVGTYASNITSGGGNTTLSGDLTITNASTSISFVLVTGNFDAGSILVYGVK